MNDNNQSVLSVSYLYRITCIKTGKNWHPKDINQLRDIIDE